MMERQNTCLQIFVAGLFDYSQYEYANAGAFITIASAPTVRPIFFFGNGDMLRVCDLNFVSHSLEKLNNWSGLSSCFSIDFSPLRNIQPKVMNTKALPKLSQVDFII